MQVNLPTEEDIKKWIFEAVQASLKQLMGEHAKLLAEDEPLLSREEITARLGVSLVTLNDWRRRGMPAHKQRGRIYFLYSEVKDYIKKNSKKRRSF